MNGGRPTEVALTREEQEAIAALKALAETWPKSLWLYTGRADELTIMRFDANGDIVYRVNRHGFKDGFNFQYALDEVGIPHDGGGW